MTDGKTPPVEYRGTGFYIGLLALLLFAVVLLVLSVQNTQNVTIDFLGWNFTIPLFGVAIGAALIAIVIDELVGLVWRRRRRSRLAERAELESLRATEPPSGGEVDLTERVTEPNVDVFPAETPDSKPSEPGAN